MLSSITWRTSFEIHLKPSLSSFQSLQGTEISAQLFQHFPALFLTCTPAHLQNSSITPSSTEYWKVLVKQNAGRFQLTKRMNWQTKAKLFLVLYSSCSVLKHSVGNCLHKKIGDFLTDHSNFFTNLHWIKNIILKWHAFITKICNTFRHHSRKTTS